MRLDLVRRQDLAQRALSERGEAVVPSRLRAVLANVLGKQPRRPQLVGIAEVLGFPARQIDNEGPRFGGDDRLPPRPRAVIERRQDTQSFRSPHAALDRLVRHPDVSSNRVERRRLTVGEQHSRPLDPARRFRPRPGKPRQLHHLLVRERQLNHPPRGAAMIQKPRSRDP